MALTATPKNHRAPWTEAELPAGSTRSVRVGPLELMVKRTASEWWVSTSRHQVDNHETTAPAKDDLEPDNQRHWVATPGDEWVTLQPATPDRPLVVRPEAPLTMMPGQEAQFFIGIPLWVQVLVGRESARPLCDLPALILSNTWFGTPTEGELCYAARTTARLDPNDIPVKPYRAVCPLTLRNSAEEPLDISRLCLRPQYLQLYEGQQHLWTSEGRMTYRGHQDWSRVVFSRKPPRFEPDALAIGQPREQEVRGLVARSFLTLKGFVDED